MNTLDMSPEQQREVAELVRKAVTPSTPVVEPAQRVSENMLYESCDALIDICEFAYKHGYHELGYDPAENMCDARDELLELRKLREALEKARPALKAGAAAINGTRFLAVHPYAEELLSLRTLVGGE